MKITSVLKYSLVRGAAFLSCLSIVGMAASISAHEQAPSHEQSTDPGVQSVAAAKRARKLPLGGGTVEYSFVKDSKGNPLFLGVRFSASVFDKLPKDCKEDKIPKTSFWEICNGGVMNDAFLTIFKTPEATALTRIASIELSWLPYGHAPEKIWDKPQFDIHFNFVKPTSGLDTAKLYDNPPEGYLPDGYIVLPQSGFKWDTPTLTYHSHSANPKASPEFGGGTFTTNFLYTVYAGRVIGYEPYVTLDFLTKAEKLKIIPVTLPKKFEHEGFYPTEMLVGLDTTTNTYIIGLQGFKKFPASPIE